MGKIDYVKSKTLISPRAKQREMYQDLSAEKGVRISMPMTEDRKQIFEDTPSPTPFAESSGGILKEMSDKKKTEK